MGTDQSNSQTPKEITATGAGRISELRPVIDMLEKPQMAALYTMMRDNVVTIPELQAEVDVTKSTVYDYVAALQRAGLVSEVETDGTATKYTAHEFVVTLEVDGMVVEVTPDVVEVLSHQETNLEIQGFLEQYGLATLAAFIDLAHQHATGDVTTRMIANLLDISRGSAYDMLEHVSRILDIGGEPSISHAADLDENERDELLER